MSDTFVNNNLKYYLLPLNCITCSFFGLHECVLLITQYLTLHVCFVVVVVALVVVVVVVVYYSVYKIACVLLLVLHWLLL